MRRLSHALIWIFIFCNSSIGQTFPVNTVFENGSHDKRINMVFLGDGYQATEMDKYNNDVQATVDKIFNESPYKEYKSFFNVYAIEVPSNESGTDHPGTASDCYGLKDSVFERDTYFDTTFDTGSIHRLIIVGNYTALNNVLMNNFPDYDMVMMVVNHNWYGGSGGTYSVFSTNVFSSEIAIHEAGHSFANLADEYEYGYDTPVQFEGINVTWRTQKELIPWSTWILDSTPIPTPISYNNYDKVVGLFEGAFYRKTGMYRPKFNCKMRELNVPFCEVCKEQHIKSIFSYVDIIDEFQPEEEAVTLFTNSKIDFNISMLQLPAKEISVRWILDDNLIGADTNSISLDGASLTTGKHDLSVTAVHRTDFVKNDPNRLLESTVSWSINVVNPTDVNEGENIPKEVVLEQNYPNPFNPATTIKYSIPPVGTRQPVPLQRDVVSVQLKIYDMLGREVAVLVNEEKMPGDYKIIFDSQNYTLTSGIYFYKLQTENYVQVKKMILIK